MDLRGWSLSDDLTTPGESVFPSSLVVPPHGWQRIWACGAHCDGQDITVEFRLLHAGEQIGLFDPGGVLVDSVVFQTQAEDVSAGRFPDGASTWGFDTVPTPGAANGDTPYAEHPTCDCVTVDEAGITRSEEIDAECDGTVEKASTWDEEGRPLTEVTASEVIRWSYEGSGEDLLTTMTRNWGDFDDDEYWTTTVTNASGQVLSLESVHGIHDEDEGWTWRKTYSTYTYNDQGQCIQVCQSEEAGDPVTSITTYTWDEHGLLVLEETDDGLDGTVDARTVRTYNDDGLPLLVERDAGADGVADNVESYTYDDAGNVLTHTEDAICDGFRNVDTWTWDGAGNMLTWRYDGGADGVVDAYGTWTWDGAGNMLTAETGNDMATAPQVLCQSFTWDDAGHVQAQRDDPSCSGTLPVCLSFTRDGAGELTWTDQDYLCDGSIEAVYFDVAC